MFEGLNFIPTTIPQAADLNRQSGINAYRNMSWTPEKRADGDIKFYVEKVAEVAEQLSIYAGTEAQKIEAAAQLERFRVKLKDWTVTLWAAKSRTASPMITGPARFPVDRNRKAMDAEMKKVTVYLDWLNKAPAAAVKAVKLAGEPPKVPEQANASITVGDVEIVTNYEIERIQMLFGGKPDAETIGMLKGAGWNWSPRNQAWQRMITDATMRSAKKIAEAYGA